MNNPYHTYCIVRKDLSPEQRIVQAVHASNEAGYIFPKPEKTSNLVLLEVPDKEALLNLSEYLKSWDLDHYVFFEPDYEMGESAICTKALNSSREKKLFSHLPLYRS